MTTDTQALSQNLRASLSRLKQRCFALGLLRGCGLALLIFLTGCVATGWLDLIYPLSRAVRMMLLVLLTFGAIAAVFSTIGGVIRYATAVRLARTLDKVGATGGQIQAGFELAAKLQTYSDPLTADLARRAIELSAQVAGRQNLAAAQPARSSVRPYLAVAGIAAVLAAAFLLWPELVKAQASRVLDPSHEHAVASPYTFTIKPSAARVIFGDPFEVTVRVAGAQEHEPFEWVVEQQGRAPWKLPLIARPDGSFGGTISAVTSEFEFFVVGRKGSSERTRIGVINTPLIQDTAVRVVYPAYTGLPPLESKLMEGGPAGVKGTKVTLLIASNRPLKGGTIEVRPLNAKPGPDAGKVTIEMKPEGSVGKAGGVVAGTITITSDLQFSADIIDTDGLHAKAPLEGRCLLVPDQKPRITIAEPKAAGYATPDIPIPVLIEAEDDFGVAEVEVFRSLNGSRETGVKLPLATAAGSSSARVQKLQTALQLSDWALDPGDSIELSAVARDNDPDGAKSSRTPTHRITIITREQYLELLRQQETIDDLYERYKPWLKRLVELRKQWDAAHKENDPKKIAALREALRESVAQLQEQIKEPPVFNADLQFAKELEELQQTLQQAMKDLEEGNYDDVDNRLDNEDEKMEREFDIPLEMLTKIYRLTEDESLFTALALVQDDLAKRTERFAKMEKATEAADIADLKSLQDEEVQVRTSLQQAVQDIRDHAHQLPKDVDDLAELIKTADEFATKVTDLKIDAVLEKAAAAMGEKRGKDADAEAKSAAELMMGLVDKINNNGGVGGRGGKFLRKFGPHIFTTINQLLGARGLPGINGNGAYSGGHGTSMGRQSNAPAIYGSKPQKRAGNGSGPRGGKGGPGDSGETLDDAKGFGMHNEFDNGASSATPLSALPGKYRSAIRDFNRRIADEGAKP